MEAVENVGEFVLWVEVGVLLLGVLGVLWAPFAAAICALVARIRKLATGSYAAAGAKHSALFILPWLYQLVRMCDRTVPRFVVGAVYGLLYATWALAFLGGQGVALVILVADVNNAEMHLPLAGMVIWIALYVVLLPLSALTWGVVGQTTLEASDRGRRKFTATAECYARWSLPRAVLLAVWLDRGLLLPAAADNYLLLQQLMKVERGN